MRICMVLHHCETPFGGPEIQALRLAELFVAEGHKVIIIARGSGRYSDFETIAGVPVYRLNNPGLASVEVLYRLFVLRNAFDIIHVHGTGRLATASIAFAHRFNKKVFVKATMNKGIVKKNELWPRTLLKKIYPLRSSKISKLKNADSMIAITGDIVDDLHKLGFEETKIAYIPNGVDTTVFYPPSDEEKRILRAQLNLPNDKTIFAFTGKITKRKGIDILLEGWEKARKANKEAFLVVIGSGVGEKDSLEEYAHSFVQKHQLVDSVCFVGAVDCVWEYLKAADVFVFPSRWEGLPNSLLEAMAVGLLCIASDIEGVNELIIPGKTGILVQVGDSDALAQVLDEALRDQKPQLSTAAAALIKKDFSIHSTKNKLQRLFEK